MQDQEGVVDVAMRGVDAPDKASLTKEEAAHWLGWSVSTFERAVAEQAAWCRESGIRGERGALLYPWQHIVTLHYIYSFMPLPSKAEPLDPEEPPRESRRKKSTRNPDSGSQSPGGTQPSPS